MLDKRHVRAAKMIRNLCSSSDISLNNRVMLQCYKGRAYLAATDKITAYTIPLDAKFSLAWAHHMNYSIDNSHRFFGMLKKGMDAEFVIDTGLNCITVRQGDGLSYSTGITEGVGMHVPSLVDKKFTELSMPIGRMNDIDTIALCQYKTARNSFVSFHIEERRISVSGCDVATHIDTSKNLNTASFCASSTLVRKAVRFLESTLGNPKWFSLMHGGKTNHHMICFESDCLSVYMNKTI